MGEYHFKRGMFLPELDLPFEAALETAREMGAGYVWFSRLTDRAPVAEWSDAEVDRIGRVVERHGLQWLVVSADNPFKEIHLTDLPLEGLTRHPLFRRDLKVLIRSMQMAQRLGVGAAFTHAFAWPGEYTADKPTWPMRWLTRGGVISETDLEKLTCAFSCVADEAERYGVDVVLGMLPWHYTNTTTNFRQVAERVGSRRIRAMWGPCDGTISGEADVATAGFSTIRPYLHSLHCKDVHIEDGLRRKFAYRPLGTGDVDYPAILRQLRVHGCDVVLSVSTHFRPASGSRVEAMRINYAHLRDLIDRAHGAPPAHGGPAQHGALAAGAPAAEYREGD